MAIANGPNAIKNVIQAESLTIHFNIPKGKHMNFN